MKGSDCDSDINGDSPGYYYFAKEIGQISFHHATRLRPVAE
jgi:hypothetical protein